MSSQIKQTIQDSYQSNEITEYIEFLHTYHQIADEDSKLKTLSEKSQIL